MKKIIIIVGPTASGKTLLSIEIAKHFGGEIINGDSVQVYKQLNIGSAKIKHEDMQGIKHHLIDIIDPSKTYSVYQFQRDVRKLFDQIDLPIIVGGTGFYINAAISRFEFIEEKRDTTFDQSFDDLSNEELYQKLIALDPLIQIDMQNRRRVLRALEQAMQGSPRSQKNKKDERLFHPLIIYLDLDRKMLKERLKVRLDHMLDEGFIEEVKNLRNQNIHLQAIGYREVDMYLDGIYSYEEMKEAILKASRRLAKKQKTYFINQMNPMVFDAESLTLQEDVKKAIQQYLEV
ncbi:MAG: tRNA (adenosine(37)-N6)-dimethylallyltransferase MiaA [Acholeplasmataceae bacterium]|jgi:tRNA dimethylallyltransferase|nr:tRNA (adenosine(37)-N6)-dimethylallyltransferase MiaA [Acholeplasmataceae bacterium]